MKQISLLIVLIFGIGSNIYSQPKIESSALKYDFGLTTQNSTITYSFWLKSTGTDTVKISKIKNNCTCVSVPLESRIIAPGDSVKLTAYWNTEQAVGTVRKYSRIYSNASSKPILVTLKANVTKSLDSSFSGSFWPFKFEMSRVHELSIDSLEFRIINATDQSISPKIVSELPDECFIVLPKEVPARGSAYGYVKLRDAFIDKEFKDSFTVDLRYGKGNLVTIPIRRKFYGSISD